MDWKGPRAGQEWETGPLSWSGDKLRFLLLLFPLDSLFFFSPIFFFRLLAFVEIFDAERKAKMEGSAFETLIKKKVPFVQAGFKTSLNPTKEFGP